MILLTPVALVGLLSLPIIYFIHFLRGTRRRQVVPATFLWADLPPAPTGSSRRRLPPITLSLLLQLAAAALATLALARPALSSAPPRHLALVVDASASMQSTDVAPSRFAAAVSAALASLDQLAPTDTVSVIRAGQTPSLLGTGQTASARTTLNQLQPGATTSNLHDAIELAEVEVSTTPATDNEVRVYTDAAGPALTDVGTLAAPVHFVTVGGGDNNQAIVGLELGTEPSDGRHEAYIEAANYASQPITVPLQTSGDGQVLDARSVSLGPRARVGLTVPVPAGVHQVSARLLVHDALSLDDTAELVVPLATPSEVQLIGPAQSVMARVLTALPFVHLQTGGGTSPQPAPALTVIQGALPATLPAGPLLLVDPPADSPLFAATGAEPRLVQQASSATHPLLQGVDLGALRLDSTFTAEPPDWADLVLGARDAPLIFDGRPAGSSILVFAFDPGSGFDKSLAFPLLVSNAVTYLLSQQGDAAVHTGQPVLAPQPSAGRASLIRPDGSRQSLTVVGGSTQVPAEATDQVGSYTVTDDANGATLRTFTTSVLDAQASDIRPHDLPDLGQDAVPPPTDAPRTLTEYWPWLAAGSLLLLVLEWLAFVRRS